MPNNWFRVQRAFGVLLKPDMAIDIRRCDEMDGYTDALKGLYDGLRLAAVFQSAVITEARQRLSTKGFRNWTELADGLPFSQDTLTKIVAGARPMTLAQLGALQVALGQMVGIKVPPAPK